MLMQAPSGGDTFTGKSGFSYTAGSLGQLEIGGGDVRRALQRNWTEIPYPLPPTVALLSPANLVPAGTLRYTSDQGEVVSNGTSWVVIGATSGLPGGGTSGQALVNTAPGAGVWGLLDAAQISGSLNVASVTGSLPVANGGFAPVDIQAFGASGTWTKPTTRTPTAVRGIQIGAGGGGGGGAQVASGTAMSGGAGGGGGAFIDMTFDPATLGATETVTIGAGGTAGAAGSAGAGGAGGAGGNTTFGSWLTAYGGGGGAGGASAAGSGGGGGAGMLGAGANSTTATGASGGSTGGGSGGTSTSSGGITVAFVGSGGGGSTATGAAGNGSGNTLYGATGGASGAGIASTPVALAGGTSGRNIANTNAAGGAANTVGSPGVGVGAYFPGSGGGGGGSSTSAAAGAGGAGTKGGGGGGGGAALTTTATAGSGAVGGTGYCVVITSF